MHVADPLVYTCMVVISHFMAFRGVGIRFIVGGGAHLTVTKQAIWRYSFAHPDICKSVVIIIVIPKIVHQQTCQKTIHNHPQ